MNIAWYAIGLTQGMSAGTSRYDHAEIGPIEGAVVVVGVLAIIIFVIMFIRFMRSW